MCGRQSYILFLKQNEMTSEMNMNGKSCEICTAYRAECRVMPDIMYSTHVYKMNINILIWLIKVAEYLLLIYIYKNVGLSTMHNSMCSTHKYSDKVDLIC